MSALAPHPYAPAAPAAAAARTPLPFELACGDDGPPTPEDFADALNVAKNAALDTLVLALSGRTDEGLPTREALFAAARILAHSAHCDRLTAAQRPSATRPRQRLPGAAHPPQMRAPTSILPREREVSPKTGGATEGATAFPTRPPHTSAPAISRTATPAPTALHKLPSSAFRLPTFDIPPSDIPRSAFCLPSSAFPHPPSDIPNVPHPPSDVPPSHFRVPISDFARLVPGPGP